MPFDFNDDSYDYQQQQDAYESPLLAPSSSPSGPLGGMFDKLKGASSGLRDKLADSQLKDSVVALGDRVGSELSQVSAAISEKSSATREAVGKSTQGLRDSISIDVESLPGRPQPQREKSRLEQVTDEYLPALSWTQRVIGCLACMAIGYTLSLGGFFRLTEAMMGNPGPFVINCTIGNIISLCGSCFLAGPFNQANKMFHESRRIATSLYLGSLALTLFVAFAAEGMTGQGIVLIVLMIIQYVAIAWYCLSYIPFARQAAKRLFNRYYNQVSNDDM
jgi:hypothetical protein